jgi:peptide/nickel transport system substrate-binding protein
MNSRRLVVVALAAVGTLVLAACSSPSSGGSSSTDFVTDGTYVTAIAQDPGDLNPLTTNLVAAQLVGAFAYDTLVYTDPSTGESKPYLAESWEETPTSVAFTLKDGITCADGTAFTAQTVADNLNWIVDPANGSPLKDSIIPGSAVATAEGNVVTVTTPEPSSFLLLNVGSSQLACEGVVEDPGSVATSSNGTGMFEVTEVVPNDHITLERRDGYDWGPDGKTTSDTPGVPKTVTIKIVTDPSTTANLLLAGELNAAQVTGADEERVTAAKLESRSFGSMSGEIIFNQYEGLPTADIAVRTALIQAADLDSYTTINTAEKGERATSMMALEPKACTYDSVDGSFPEFDADAAAKTLADAGWTKGSGGKLEKDGEPLSVNVVYINSVDSKSAAAEYLGKQWEDLGVTVKLSGGDTNFLISNTFSATDPSAWTVAVGLTLQSNVPSIFPAYFSGPTAPDGTNFGSVDNPEYTKLSTEAANLAGDESCAKWEEAEHSLFDHVDVLPISVTPTNLYFNGALSTLDPVAGVLPGAAIRVLAD